MNKKTKIDLLEYIICPQCKSEEIRQVKNHFQCTSCKSKYPIIDNILVLIKPKGQKAILNLWNKKKHLNGFKFFTTKKVGQLAKKFTNRSTITLDVGCGTGAYQKDFKGSVISFDYVPFFLKKAASKFKSDNRVFLIADATEFPFRSNKFDLVFCSQVIEHFKPKDTNIVLKNMIRATKNRVVLDTPNDGNLIIRILRKVFYPGVADSDPSNPDRDPRMMHHKLMGRTDFEKHGFDIHSCIGYVSRHKFKLGSFWDVYDFFAWRLPDFGGNLIAIFTKKI